MDTKRAIRFIDRHATKEVVVAGHTVTLKQMAWSKYQSHAMAVSTSYPQELVVEIERNRAAEKSAGKKIPLSEEAAQAAIAAQPDAVDAIIALCAAGILRIEGWAHSPVEFCESISISALMTLNGAVSDFNSLSEPEKKVLSSPPNSDDSSESGGAAPNQVTMKSPPKPAPGLNTTIAPPVPARATGSIDVAVTQSDPAPGAPSTSPT